MKTLTIQSPAKLNLYLQVTGRRSNGYHNLLSVFHRISLADTLKLNKVKSGFLLKTNNPRLPVDQRNLITRAYALLQKEFPRVGGVHVRLTKRIPLGSGLGGGSSNAAFFLLGMKKLYGLKISQKALLRLGLCLGADVPFFLSEAKTAIVEGIGERVQRRPSKRRLWFLLVLSDQALMTQKVFKKLPRKLPGASLTKGRRAVTLICDFLKGKNHGQIGEILRNDLESPAFRLRPSLRSTFAKLQKCGVDHPRMSGSGPTVFAMVSKQSDVRQLQRSLRRNFFRNTQKQQRSKNVIICHSF